MRNLPAILCLITLITVFTIPSNAQFIETYAGNGIAASTGDGGPATAASINEPGGVCRDDLGNLYIVEYGGNKVRIINSAGIVNNFAGTGVPGFGGDGGPATAGSFNTPIDIIEDHVGNFYITDNVNQRIRKISSAGIITTFAGNGSIAYTGDGGPATDATMRNPSRLAVDEAGNIYFADAGNNVIRMIDTTGIIHTVAGNGIAAYSGDGGQATAASLNLPLGVNFDANGNMYIADGDNYRIRKVTTTGIISTWAGNGTYGFSGDGGPATAASMQYPNAVSVDASCNVYFTDWDAQRTRKITSTGIISTVVGNGVAGFSGDGGPATAAMIDGPNNLTYDHQSNLYIPDFYNNRIRQVLKLGDTTGCPPITPVASFAAVDSSICMDSCNTFSSTSTGTIDSVLWTATGESISNPTANSTSICFITSGTITIHLYAYGVSSVDSSSETIIVNNCTAGIANLNTNQDDFWLSQLNDYTIMLNSSQPIENPLSIIVYDATGRKMLNETWGAGTYSKQMNNSFLPSGMYIIKLSNSKVFKWIKE